jgi:dipeptidyl aminopeptidase/acylaminoacyl peptidase
METIPYGNAPSQVADHLAVGGAACRVVLVHGGFWRVAYGRDLMLPLAADLVARGIDVWNLEYRRVGEAGGGWPGTFDDVATAVRDLVGPGAFAIGHSAGGHLALWLAAEGLVAGAASLAGVADLVAGARDRLGGDACVELLGGGPADVPDRYAAASPAERLPFGAPQLLVHGDRDDRVPVSQSIGHAAAATAAGDDVELVVLPGVGHFEVIDPAHEPSWAPVVEWAGRLSRRTS